MRTFRLVRQVAPIVKPKPLLNNNVAGLLGVWCGLLIWHYLDVTDIQQRIKKTQKQIEELSKNAE